MKNSNETIGNRTRDLPACSAVPQPTAPPRAPKKGMGNIIQHNTSLWIVCIICWFVLIICNKRGVQHINVQYLRLQQVLKVTPYGYIRDHVWHIRCLMYRTSPLPAQCSHLLAEIYRVFSLTLYSLLSCLPFAFFASRKENIKHAYEIALCYDP
jgi:hypothetical protein